VAALSRELPEQQQLQFWHEQFLPLLAQEHALLEELQLAGHRISPGATMQ
jgi:phosphoserine phosphatase